MVIATKFYVEAVVDLFAILPHSSNVPLKISDIIFVNLDEKGCSN